MKTFLDALAAVETYALAATLPGAEEAATFVSPVARLFALGDLVLAEAEAETAVDPAASAAALDRVLDLADGFSFWSAEKKAAAAAFVQRDTPPAPVEPPDPV